MNVAIDSRRSFSSSTMEIEIIRLLFSVSFEALDWNHKPDGRALSRIRFNATASADVGQALGHVAQAITTRGRRFRMVRRGIETSSIVRRGDFQSRPIV